MTARFVATIGLLQSGFRQIGKRCVWLAAAAMFCGALLVRLPGYRGQPLWIDELWRALLILNPAFWRDYFFAPSVESAITSLGYAFFLKCLGLLRISPDILRLSSLIPGVLAVLVAFFLTRKAGGGVALASLAGLMFALNRSFISYSDEMKPYMFEVFVHMATLYAWLTMLQAPRPTIRKWLLYFFALLFAVLSTSTAVFLLPASGLTLFMRFLIGGADKGRRNRDLAICTGIFTAIGAVVAILYYFAWRHGSNGDMHLIWASGFFEAGSYLRFLASMLMQMWRASFDTVVNVPRQTELGLASLAAMLVWAIVSRKVLRAPMSYFLLFYLALAATVCVVNFAQIWPLGASRVNLFLYAYLIIFAFLLAAELPFSDAGARLCLLGGCLFLLWHAHSTAGRAYYRSVAANLRNLGAPVERSDLVIDDFSADGPVGRTILADCPRQKTLVLADNNMSTAVSYFTKYDEAHRQGAALLESRCVRYVKYTEAYLQPADTDSTLSKILPAAWHAWFIHSHLGNDEVAALRRIAEHYGHVTHLKTYEGAGYFELIVHH